MTKGYKMLQLAYEVKKMNTRFPLFLILLVASVLALTSGCSGDDSTLPLQLDVSSSQNNILNQGEALVLSASGLTPGEFPVLIEALTSGGAVASQVRLTADRYGDINDVILAYDAGYWTTPGNGRLSPGTYTIRLTTDGGTVETEITVPAVPDSPTVRACDIDGNLANAFTEGDPVFVMAISLQPGASYRVWPVADRRSWKDGDIIKSWQSEAPAIVWPPEIHEYIDVVADGDGKLEPTQLLAYATKLVPSITDQFDVVIDAEPFGVFNADTDAVDGQIPTGVVVQEPHPGGPIYAELASRADYTYTNSFTVGDQINVWLNPGFILDQVGDYVLKYILLHSDEWPDGISIEDITGGIELDPVQEQCVNEGLILVWMLAEIGEYDVLMDINANGIYDEGIDVLDGGPGGPGFVVTE